MPFATLLCIRNGVLAVAEIGEPERKVRREREDQPSPAMPQPVTVPETVPASN
jgi:hypothetical protein